MSAKLWVKRVICGVVFVLFSAVVVNVGNDKFSVFCRDNPKGASCGLINFGAKAMNSVVSLVGVLESESEQSFILSGLGRSAGKAEAIITLMGVASGKSGFVTATFFGVSFGRSESVILSIIGVSFTTDPSQEISGLVAIRYLKWNDIMMTLFWSKKPTRLTW